MSTQALKAAATGRPLAEMKPKEQIAYLLNQKKGELAKMLPKTLSIDRLLKVAQIAATTTPALAKCDVASLVGAIGQCAQMGLEPNTVLGHAYLVPFNTKRKDAQGNERWVNSVQVIIGYKGLIDLARRSGQIISIATHEVCENDHFELVYGLDEKLNHTPAMGDRGDLIGFYAIAKLKDGGHCFEFMSLHQVEKIMADTQSKGKYGPWKDHFVQMGRKTVVRRLSNYLPLSIEFQTAAALDGMAEAGKDQNLDTIDGDFMIVPDDAPQVDPETGEIGYDPSPSLADRNTQRRSNVEVVRQQPQDSRAPEKQAGATLEAQRKVADQVRADYGDREAEHFEPNEPLPAQSGNPAFNPDAFATRMEQCSDVDTLDLLADEVSGMDRDGVITEATAQSLLGVYRRCREALINPAAAKPAATSRRARSNSTAPE